MKYIDAERLKAKIKERIEELDEQIVDLSDSKAALRGRELLRVLDLIDSLQQEFPTTANSVEEFLATHPKVEVPEKYKTPDWLWKKQEQPEVFDTVAFQKGVQEGKRLEREDVKSTIQSRIDEILGDAQPNPILRMELQELIKKIES